MPNPRKHAAPMGRVLTPFQGLAVALVLCLLAFWLPLITLVGESL
jgi:hypothetical protein